MNVPGSLDQLVLFVLFVLPGITFSTIRVALSGWKSPDYGVGARVLEALFVSALFDGAYLLILGEVLAREARHTPDVLAWVSTANVGLLLGLLIGLPALVACLMFLRPTIYKTVTQKGKKRVRVQLRSNYRSVPQAWDFKVLKKMREGHFVRVRTEGGLYYGGWYGAGSLASTYPHDRDLFIEKQWRMGPAGEFISEIEDSRGLWMPITDKTVVEWLAEPKQGEGEPNG